MRLTPAGVAVVRKARKASVQAITEGGDQRQVNRRAVVRGTRPCHLVGHSPVTTASNRTGDAGADSRRITLNTKYLRAARARHRSELRAS